jgi:sulfate transport system permease protein
VSLVNAVMGTLIAWVLTQYRVPGRQLISAIVDLPLTLPTLVIGVVWVALVGPQSAFGQQLARGGFSIAYSPAAIVIVLLFVTLPLMVRAVEPVLLDMDPAEEEAAKTLGATPRTIFLQLTLRALAPTISYGTLQCFARCLAEFGAVVVVSGNIAMRTLTAPVYVYGQVESGASQAAAALSVVLLGGAGAVSYLSRAIQRRGAA